MPEIDTFIKTAIAKCINAEPEEMSFTSGGTEADNLVIKDSTCGSTVSSHEHRVVLDAAAKESYRRHGIFNYRTELSYAC